MDNGIEAMARERYPGIALEVSLPALRQQLAREQRAEQEETRRAVQNAMYQHQRMAQAQQVEEQHHYAQYMCSTAMCISTTSFQPLGQYAYQYGYADWRAVYGTAVRDDEVPNLARMPQVDRDAANAKAHALLLEHLGEEEYKKFLRRGWLHLSPGVWEWYLFIDGSVYMRAKNTVRKLCIQPESNCPTMDKIVAMKLSLEHNEHAVNLEANELQTYPWKEFKEMLKDED